MDDGVQFRDALRELPICIPDVFEKGGSFPPNAPYVVDAADLARGHRQGCASHAHGIAQSLAEQGTPLTPEVTTNARACMQGSRSGLDSCVFRRQQQSYVQHVPAPPVPAPSRATEIFEAASRQHGYADRAASTEEASAEVSAPGIVQHRVQCSPRRPGVDAP